MAVQLKVHSPTGQEKIIKLCDNEEQMKEITVLQLKEKIMESFMIRDGDLDLAFGIETLQEETLLISYKIRHLSNIHTTLKLPGGI